MKSNKDFYARAQSRYTNFWVTEPTTLMDFLIQKMPEASRTTIKNLLAKRLVHVDGIITKAFDYPLKAKMKVQISQDKNRKPFSSKLLDIVHEDAYFIVINKFAGTPSSPIRGKEAKSSALYILENYIKQYHSRRKIYPIYKLDEDYSGLMLFAKDEQTKESFDEKWNSLVKEYTFLAICDGKPEKDSGKLISWVVEGKTYFSNSAMSSDAIDKAETKYKMRKVLPNGQYLMEFSLLTPRRNQMKLHAKELGCPIAGDVRYNPNSTSKQLLAHAYRLAFKHPVTNEFLQLELPLPDYMQEKMLAPK